MSSQSSGTRQLAPKKDPLEQLREQFQRQIEEVVQNPESYFSEEELEAVDKRLDQLYEDFSRISEELKLTQKQLNELQAEIKEFKGSARSYQQGVWAKITANKLVKTAGKMVNTPEGRKFLFDQARKLLGLSES